MWRRLKTAVGIILIVLLAPFVLLLIVLTKLTGHDKADLTKEEVLEYLRRMDAGEVDGYAWDDFVNVPIKDAELDKVRERCAEIWNDVMNGYLVSDEDFRLNARGHQEIKQLIEQCESMRHLT